MLVSKEFYGFYVTLPSPNETPPEIGDDGRFFPWFAGCLGAIDGSLLDAFVPTEDMSRYRSRKGRISTNLLAACRFNLLFCYILSGWEGSATDGRVFDDARRNDFPIPPGKFYLGDAGFPLCDGLIVPYRGVRYHLKEWEQSGLRYSNSSSQITVPVIISLQASQPSGTIQSSPCFTSECHRAHLWNLQTAIQTHGCCSRI
jgi:hypothetical protein